MAVVVDLPREPLDFFEVQLNGTPVATAYPPSEMPGIVRLKDNTSGITYQKEKIGGVFVWTDEGSAPVVPLHDIAYGTGTGITGDQDLTWNPITRTFDVRDDLNVVQLEIDGQASINNRSVQIRDSAGQALVNMQTGAASRSVTVEDGAGVTIEVTNALTAGRTQTTIDSAGMNMALRNTVAANRLDDLYDVNGAVMMRSDTKTGAAARSTKWIDELGTAFFSLFTTSNIRVLDVFDPSGLIMYQAFAAAASRNAQYNDSNGHVMQKIITLAATRNITETDEAGAVTMLATLLAGSKAYQFGASGAAAKHNLDLVNLVDTLLAADGTTTTANWNWGTGQIGLQSTDASGTPGNVVINKPMGRAAIAAGASTCQVTNSTVLITDTVLAISMTRDATGLALLPTTVANGSFTVTTSAGTTGNQTFAFVVFKHL